MPANLFAKFRWLRFSLAKFLLASFCVGVILAGYRSGDFYGYQAGKAKRYDETQISAIYDTTMIISADLSAADRADKVASLKQLFKTTGTPGTWNPGTNNQIEEIPATPNIVVTAPGRVQHQIRDLITRLERLSTRGATDNLLPSLEQLAAQGRTETRVLPTQSPKNNQLAGAWLDGYYEAAITDIAAHWGAPRFRGKCIDADFPSWSLDQQIAIWPRGNGVSYVALHVAEDGQLHIVAGWHGNNS